MNTNKDEALLFASESSIFRIISTAKIVSWVVLAIYLVSFVMEVSNYFQGNLQWPTQVAQWPITIANLLFAPTIGLFYFLVLQGVAQGLNLGLDIFFELHPEESTEAREEV